MFLVCRGYANSWATTADFIDSTGGTKEQVRHLENARHTWSAGDAEHSGEHLHFLQNTRTRVSITSLSVCNSFTASCLLVRSTSWQKRGAKWSTLIDVPICKTAEPFEALHFCSRHAKCTNFPPTGSPHLLIDDSWPSTGTSDVLKLRLDSAGVDNAAGVYYHQVTCMLDQIVYLGGGFLSKISNSHCPDCVCGILATRRATTSTGRRFCGWAFCFV